MTFFNFRENGFECLASSGIFVLSFTTTKLHTKFVSGSRKEVMFVSGSRKEVFHASSMNLVFLIN